MLFHCALHGHGHAAREYHLTVHIIQHTHNTMLWDLASMVKVCNRMHSGDCSSARAQGQSCWAHAWHSLSFFCSENDPWVVTPPRVTPTSVVMHGVGETCVEVNGPQVEEERMCGPEGGSHLPLCQYHHTVNIMSKKSCLKGVKKAEGRVGKWRQLQFFIYH